MVAWHIAPPAFSIPETEPMGIGALWGMVVRCPAHLAVIDSKTAYALMVTSLG